MYPSAIGRTRAGRRCPPSVSDCPLCQRIGTLTVALLVVTFPQSSVARYVIV
jgi:hypothetical protein